MANQAVLGFRSSLRRVARRGRRLASGALAPVTGVAAQLVPVAAAAVVGAAAVTAASVALSDQPAQASVSGTALILSTSVNGGTSSLEAQQATALGLTVTVATPTTWDAMTTAQFQSYNVIILGDSSTSTACATTVPADALSTSAIWGAAVNGSVSVLGTAPAMAGSSATLVSDAIAYAASGGSGKTGLYVSLNCYYSTAAVGTDVTLLDNVQGGGFYVTGQSANCPADAGTVNTWEALALPQFNGLTSADLGPWASPACSVQETLNAWPAGLNGVGYYAGATPADFTASDGATGQAYIVAGAPVASETAALAPSTGGQVPAGATAAGANAAAPGVNQPASNGVNTATGDFSQSSTDLSIPTFGPSLSFSRSYDSQVAQAQTRTGTPGPMGYGWTDNWASSLQIAKPTLGSIYTVGGLRTDNGDGGPSTGGTLSGPGQVILSNGNVYIADTAGNRIQEIPGTSGTQWGLSMTAGDIYTIVGSPSGAAGDSFSGTPIAQSQLDAPGGVAVDAAGNLYIADTSNARVLEVPVSSGTQRGVSMTADDLYVIAGIDGAQGLGSDNIAAARSRLSDPINISLGAGSSQDLYIADSGNNRIQEVPATSKTDWGQTMTANFVYTVAGSSAGTAGISANGTAATSSLLSMPEGVTVSAAGNLFIGDTANCRVAEVPPSAGTQWGQPMTADDLYTVAGRGGPANCSIGNDNKISTQSNLLDPVQVAVGPGTKTDLYLADSLNNRIQEVSATNQTEWGQSMTATFIYTVAGSPSGTAGFSGDGGGSTSATMRGPGGVAVGSVIYTSDTGNNRAREVSSAGVISELAGNGGTLAQTGDGGSAFMAGLAGPQGEVFDAAGNMYIADTVNNRIQEIAAVSHTQYGIAMTAGDVYTIAGSATGAQGSSGDGGQATAALLNTPMSVSMDAAGNLYIADTNNCRVQEVAANGVISTVAGFATPTCGLQASPYGDGVAATASELSQIEGVQVDLKGDIYIADTFNNRIQEVFAAGGQAWGQSMVAGDMYTMAGQASGASGTGGGNGIATAAYLHSPVATGLDATGNMYIADWFNNRIQMVAAVTARMRNRNMTYKNIYTIAGSVGGTAGLAGDGGAAASALLDGPGNATSDAAGNLYITDGKNNRVQEIAVADGTQWGQSMSANDIYTVAGSAAGTAGDSGDGGPATAALMNLAENVSLDPAGNMYITDGTNNLLREVAATTTTTIEPAPGQASTFSPAPGGITITQPDGSQVTFYSQSAGACGAPYVVAGSYCALPQDVGAALSLSGGVYTFTQQPGAYFTYNAAGLLTGETDAAGNALAITYGQAPGAGSCPSNSSTATCQVITSASTRALTVGYSSANLVTSVTDPMGRAWSYGYTGADLTSATDPMGHVTTYGYDTGNANPVLASDITTITDPNGQPGGPNAGTHTTIAYDTAGSVTSQTDPMGYVTSYDWSGYNASTGNGVTTVTGPDGNKTVYYYTQGTLGAVSVWTGTTLNSENDFVPDQAVSGGSGGTQLLKAMTDANGRVTTVTYDAAGNPVSNTAPDGIVNPDGTLQLATLTSQYTALDEPACDSAAIASSTCSASPGPAPVSPGGAITPPSSAPPLGVTWTLYDTRGNVLYSTTGVYEPGSNTAAYARTTYQLFNGNTITLNGNNISCSASAPSPSLPCASINADGVVAQFAYDSGGDLTSSSVPDGNGSELATTTAAYDGDGEPVSATSPDGNLAGANAGNYTITTAYDSDGLKTSVTQGGGTGATVTPRTTSYGYDANGNNTNVTDPQGYTTTVAFNPDDQRTLVTNPDGNSVLTCYDGSGNVTQTVPPVGVAANGLSPASCPSGYAYPSTGYGQRLAADATTYTYNGLGERTAMTTPAPAGQSGFETTSFSYDANGNLTQTVAPATSNGGQGQTTTAIYDPAGHRISETVGAGTPAASTTSFCYDPNGDQTAMVYPDGNASGTAPCETASPWTVSASANPAQAAYQTTYGYDSAGELVSTTAPATAAAPNGATATATYDAVGYKLTATDPNNVTATYAYTPDGLTSGVSYSGSSAHSANYAHDASGQITSVTDATGTSSFAYDPFGELTSTTNGAGQTTGYGYDANGDNTSITYPLPVTATWATSDTISYTLDHAGLLTGVTDFNGNTITIGNSADGLPISAALGASGDTIATTYDNAGLPAAITLTNATTTLQGFSYSRAPAGNILSETDTPASAQSPITYTYDARRRLTSMTPGTGPTMSYGFDPSGNLTVMPGGAAGTYDNAGELTSATAAGVTTSYTYNAAGQRLTATQGSTATASGTWNGAGQLTAYTDPAAAMSGAAYTGAGLRTSATFTPSGGSPVTQNFVWNAPAQVPNLLMDSGNAYIYTTGQAPAEEVNLTTGTITYLITDSLGSVRGIVDSTGTLTGTTSYDAWGNPMTTGGLTATTPFGYAGGYTDPTGLIYLTSRYYDPATGQFTSPDPLVAQTWQPYAYAAGDPVTGTDPTGLCSQSWCPPPPVHGTAPPSAYGPGSRTGVYTYGFYTVCASCGVYHFHGSKSTTRNRGGTVAHRCPSIVAGGRIGLPTCGTLAQGDPLFRKVVSAAWNHTYLQAQFCIVACVSLTEQGGHFIAGFSGPSLTYRFQNKISLFGGYTRLSPS